MIGFIILTVWVWIIQMLVLLGIFIGQKTEMGFNDDFENYSREDMVNYLRHAIPYFFVYAGIKSIKQTISAGLKKVDKHDNRY